MSKLHISSKLSLPIDTVTQTVGILAKRRAGKSYTARRLTEQLCKAGQQVVIVDPKGDWWGIRSAADGKSPGLAIIILGGERADVPLEVHSGEVVAKLVTEERVSVVLDLSLFRKHEVATFMTAFLENLYRLKAREQYRTPLMLVIDEADAVAPQRPQKGEERMLGAAEDIVRRGGQRGIGCTLITQRSAVLNKNVLTQIQLLVALRTISPQDLAALNAWIDVHGTEKQRDKLMESLPALPVGDAWFWSPGWPTTDGIFQLVTVYPIETFDSGATPKPGQKRVEPKHVADVDLEALRRQMAATIERAKAEDPRELRKQVAELKRRVFELQKTNGELGLMAVEIQSKEVPVLKDSQIARLEGAIMRFEARQPVLTANILACCEMLEKAVRPIREALVKVRDGGPPSPAGGPPALPRPQISRSQRAPLVARPDATSPRPVEPREKALNFANGDSVSLGSGERRCAIAIAQHPNGVTREQLTTLTGYKRSTRNTYLQRLQAAELAREDSGRFLINDAGVAWLGNEYEPLPTGDRLQNYWINRLPEGESRVFQTVLSQPDGITRDQIGELTDYKRSTRNTYLQRLVARELVSASGETIRPSDTLFA